MANEITQAGALKVLLTGATGAAGRAAVRLLSAQGYHVVGATTAGFEGSKQVREDGGIPAYPNLLRAGELRSAMLTAEADVVVNLAPQMANHALRGGDDWDPRLMAEGTAALVEAATAANVKYLVHTSYMFAGGEDEVAEPLIRAARTGEQIVLGSSVPACVLRFGFVYGAASPELIAARKSMAKGRAVPGGDPHAHGYWLYAEDAANAIHQALLRRPTGVTLNISDGHPASVMEFMSYFADAQGLTPPSKGSRQSLRAMFTGEAPLDVSRIHVHAEAGDADKEFGWAPRYASYRQGIDDVLLSWRAEKELTL
ncbi:MAG: NAD-dependent epimerase/dehydratase family protein [Chloroflexi bacterium]|nr:NAD-dependent epimerase/dehydratase family protein [Chloroflexota bacterium]